MKKENINTLRSILSFIAVITIGLIISSCSVVDDIVGVGITRENRKGTYWAIIEVSKGHPMDPCGRIYFPTTDSIVFSDRPYFPNRIGESYTCNGETFVFVSDYFSTIKGARNHWGEIVHKGATLELRIKWINNTTLVKTYKFIKRG